MDKEENTSPGPVETSPHDGTKGFNPQLAGNAKAGKYNTSSFDATSAIDTRINNTDSSQIAGLEEGGRLKQRDTSAAGQIVSNGKNNP